MSIISKDPTRSEELIREIQRTEIEPDFSKNLHLQELKERAENGNELDEIAYRDELHRQTEEFFKEIETTPEYQETDTKLQELCEQFADEC